MMLTILCAVAAYFSFAGGSDQQLASAVARQLKKPIVILADASRVWPKVEVKDEPSDSTAKAVLASSLKSSPISDEGLGICAKGWPAGIYQTDLRSNYESSFRSTGKVSFQRKGERISIQTIGGAVPIGELLTDQIASGAYSWHWFFEEARLTVDCNNILIKDYIKLIAEALGANVEKSKLGRGKYFDLNPKEYRTRAVALADEMYKTLRDPAGQKYNYLLLSNALSHVQDSQIVKLMEQPNQELELDMSKNRSFQKLAWRRLEAKYPVNPNDGIKRHPSATETWKAIQKAIDPNKPVRLILFSKGMAACRFGGTSASPGGVVL